MNLLQSTIIGIIQGITEWLPISSEGITSLILIKFFKESLAEALPLSIFLHLGTLLAAILYFKKDIKYIIKKPKSNITTFLIISTLAGITGLPLFLLIQNFTFNTKIATALIGISLIITALIQKLSKENIINQKSPTKKDALLLGIIQSFSIIPGLSRSGLTTSALLFKKYSAEQALRLSFLMSIPAVLAAQIALKFLNKINFSIYSLISLLFSFIFGLLTIKLLLNLAKKINFSYFCFFLGILTLVSIVF